MEFVSNIKVSPAQVDDLGHLNHVHSQNLATLVLNINFNYRQECFLDEALQIITRPVERGSKSFSLSQEVIKPDGGLAIDGTATSLVMDMERHRSVQVPECLAGICPRASSPII